MKNLQTFVAETDSFAALRRCLELALPACLESTDWLALKMVPVGQEHRALHLPSCLACEIELPVQLISGWHSKDASWFNGYRPFAVFEGGDQVNNQSVIARVIDVINTGHKDCEQNWLPRMISANDSARDFEDDGSTIKLGYRLQTTNSFPQILAIYPCLIYYGK